MQHFLNSYEALIANEKNIIANLANTSAFLNEYLEKINWIGFYLWNDAEKQLILGPFQGKVACNRIDLGAGVCGSAYAEKKTLRIADVDLFPGHIVCDSASKSELVIPFWGQSGEISGVLDIDSPIVGRFTEQDQVTLEEYVKILEKYI